MNIFDYFLSHYNNLMKMTRSGWQGIGQRSILHVVEYIRPDPNPHPGALHGDKIMTTRRWPKTGRPTKGDGMTNNERVRAMRARRSQ